MGALGLVAMDAHENFSSFPPTFLHESFHFARLSCVVARGRTTRYNQVCSHVTVQKAEGFANVSFFLRRDWRHKHCVDCMTGRRGKLVGICSKSNSRKPAKDRDMV